MALKFGRREAVCVTHEVPAGRLAGDPGHAREFGSSERARPSIKACSMDARVGSPMRAATRAIDAVVTIASPPEVHSTTPACPRVRSRP